MGRTLRPLAPLGPKLVRLYPQHLSDPYTQLLGLYHRVNEVGQFVNADSLFQVDHRLATKLAHRHIPQHVGQLGGEGAFRLVRDAGEGGVQSQARLDAGSHEVKRVR